MSKRLIHINSAYNKRNNSIYLKFLYEAEALVKNYEISEDLVIEIGNKSVIGYELEKYIAEEKMKAAEEKEKVEKKIANFLEIANKHFDLYKFEIKIVDSNFHLNIYKEKKYIKSIKLQNNHISNPTIGVEFIEKIIDNYGIRTEREDLEFAIKKYSKENSKIIKKIIDTLLVESKIYDIESSNYNQASPSWNGSTSIEAGFRLYHSIDYPDVISLSKLPKNEEELMEDLENLVKNYATSYFTKSEKEVYKEKLTYEQIKGIENIEYLFSKALIRATNSNKKKRELIQEIKDNPNFIFKN